MVSYSYSIINVFNKFFVLCAFCFSFKSGYCSLTVQAVDSEYSAMKILVESEIVKSENFFSRDVEFQSRIQYFLDVKNYAFRGLKGPEAKSSADDIVDSLMSWYYPQSLSILKRNQVLAKVLKDFRECCEYYKQDSVSNPNIISLLAPFCAVKRALGK